MVQKNLKIVHVLRAPMGGILRHVRDIALDHDSQGHDVGIICDVPGTPGYNEALLADLAPSLSLGLTRTNMSRSIGASDISASWKIRNIIKALKPHIVHGHGAKGGVYARVCGSMVTSGNARPKRIYSPHGGSLHFDENSSKGKLYFGVERALEKMTDCICFVADYEARTYRTKIGTPTCPTQIVYNGLDEAEFVPVKNKVDAADFLFIGEMRMLKGPDMMLEALAGIKAAGHNDISAIMVGDGPDRDAIIDLVEKLGLTSNITIHKPMPARDAFALANTVVIPSRAEAMPYIVLEALGARKPLITTSVGGIPEIFGAAKAILAQPETASIKKLMERALHDLEDFKRQMPKHEALSSQFSVKSMAADLLKIYHKQ